LPPAALTGYSPDEIEMVLLHELAHVRRWDNLINLIQRIVESLLFFHPAVWLISSWVRRERESCCDREREPGQRESHHDHKTLRDPK
jgi:beta-lactamase regulating signal transducer with metallopeptidase domain